MLYKYYIFITSACFTGKCRSESGLLAVLAQANAMACSVGTKFQAAQRVILKCWYNLVGLLIQSMVSIYLMVIAWKAAANVPWLGEINALDAGWLSVQNFKLVCTERTLRGDLIRRVYFISTRHYVERSFAQTWLNINQDVATNFIDP